MFQIKKSVVIKFIVFLYKFFCGHTVERKNFSFESW